MKSVIICIILFFYSFINAQDIKMGFKFAPTLNFDNTYINGNYQNTFSNGLKLGLTSELVFDTISNLSIAIEPSYDYRKNKYEFINSQNINSSYLEIQVFNYEIPFFLRYGIGNKNQFVTDLGIMYQLSEVKYDNKTTIKIKDDFTNSSFCFIYGFGFRHKFESNSNFLFILRHKIVDNQSEYSSNQISLNTIFSF